MFHLYVVSLVTLSKNLSRKLSEGLLYTEDFAEAPGLSDYLMSEGISVTCCLCPAAMKYMKTKVTLVIHIAYGQDKRQRI